MNAISVWGVARAFGGRVLLRIEDHDRLRCRPTYEQSILEDLDWLGFHADAGPQRQSDEPQAYEASLDRLARLHHVYACDCVERFDDARLGTQEQAPASQCGDLLLSDRDGFWTYQFAVTTDDCRQDVDLVIRGEDLLRSTGQTDSPGSDARP